MRPSFPRHFAIVPLLAAALIALGCGRESPPTAPAPDAPAPKGDAPTEQPKTGAADGSGTTDKTPDGQSLVVTFPGKPEWTDVPDLKPPTKGFVWRGDEKSKQCAAWVWTIPADERTKKSEQELSSEYTKKAAYVRDNGAYFSEGQDPRGAGWAGWQSRPYEEGDEHRNDGTAGAGSVLIVGDKAYCLRVWGSELALTDPDVKAFFQSLKIAELETRPALAKPPEDDLRPLARDGTFINQAAIGVHTTGIAILPERGAFRTTYAYTPNFDPSSARLTRYKYPTFQPDGAYKLPGISYLSGADEPRNRLYLSIQGTGGTSKLARFDVPEQLGAGKVEEIKGLKTIDGGGSVISLRPSSDGKTLFGLSAEFNTDWSRKSAEVVRIDAEELKRVGKPLAIKTDTAALCLSPDGKTLYAGAWTMKNGLRSTSECLVQEIDVADWKVRRTFTIRGNAAQLQCGADGRLYTFSGEVLVRADPTGPGEPKVRLVSHFTSHTDVFLSTDAKRLYLTGAGSHPYSLDTKELFDHGRFVIAPERMRDGKARMFGGIGSSGEERIEYSAGGILSSDGKCLWLNSGPAFWLTGAGALPEVDKAQKWKP